MKDHKRFALREVWKTIVDQHALDAEEAYFVTGRGAAPLPKDIATRIMCWEPERVRLWRPDTDLQGRKAAVV